MKERFVRKLRYWIDRDLIATRKALTVTVRLVEGDPLNAEGLKRSLGVPLRDRDWPKLAAKGLTDDEPSCLVNERRKGLFFLWLAALTNSRTRYMPS